MGMRISAGTLLQPAALIVMAVPSKLACGLGLDRNNRCAGVDRWLVVFATTALNQGLLDAVPFYPAPLMVTFIAVVRLLLERRFERGEAVPERAHS